MRKVLTTTFLLLLMISFKNVSALENDTYIINNNNVSISEERFLELMDAGYTIDDIYNMDLDTYNNADTNNPEIALSTKYLKTITTTRYGNTTSETIEITEEEYNNSESSNISFYASGTVNTTYKKLTSSIEPYENNSDFMKYRTYMHWKIMPAVRSNDIIGMSFYSSMVDTVYAPTFTQLYTINGLTYTSHSAYVTEFANGAGAVFDLSDTATTLNQEIVIIVSKVNYNSTITSLNSKGDYSHAVETVSGTTANNNYQVNTTGIALYSAINSKYDDMAEAPVLWTGTW